MLSAWALHFLEDEEDEDKLVTPLDKQRRLSFRK